MCFFQTYNNGCLPDIFSDYSLKAVADIGMHHKNICFLTSWGKKYIAV